MAVPRALNPQTNAPGWIAAASALYAAGLTLWHWHNHTGPVDWNVVYAAVAAVAAMWARGKVTPVADPRDGNGQPLKTANAHAADNFRAAMDQAVRTGRLTEPLPMPPTTAGAQPDVTLAEPAYPPPENPPQKTP